MKLRIIKDTLNVHNSVEFLTNAIMSDESQIILDSEIGSILIHVPEYKTHNAQDPDFGITLCRFREAPMTSWIYELSHSNESENYRWYLEIPYVEGQSKDFTRALVVRALMWVFLSDILEDTDYDYRLMDVSVRDAACSIYNMNYLTCDGYTYQPFNRELCKLSLSPLQRVGQGYRSFLLSNREILRIRERQARSSAFRTSGTFSCDHDIEGKMSFGGAFYRAIFALIINSFEFRFRSTTPLKTYGHLTRRSTHGEPILPIAVMKICLHDSQS